MRLTSRFLIGVAILVLVACGATLDTSTPCAPRAEVATLGADLPEGALLAPGQGSDQALASARPVYTDPGELPKLQVRGEEGQLLPLEHTHVSARLTGFIAEVEVRQTYGNPSREPIEAVYIFPLPENSAVNHMRIEIGDRVVEAQIRRRDEARREYEAARREGYTAALLEQERPNVFTQSIANIAPGERIDVAIRYVQDLTYDAGEYEFVFPMVVGPRFIPGQPIPAASAGEGTYADTDEVPDASRITPPILGRGQRSGHDISLEVVADPSLVVGALQVLTHEVTAGRTDDGALHLALAERESLPNRDFVLRYRVAQEQPRATLFLSEPNGGGYFSLAVHPPVLDVDSLVGRREIIFVVDVSGSMSGTPLSLCRVAMREALGALRPVDTFDIITFSGASTRAFGTPRPANDANLRDAFRVVDEMTAGGGTYMADAIAAALSPEVEQGRHRYVFFLTDGYVGNEDAILAATDQFVTSLEGRGQRARVFGFGVGSSVNRALLDGLGRSGRGTTVYVTTREDPARAVNQFFRYIDHSVLEDVSVEWADLGQRDVEPGVIPDLFASHALILHGRYEALPQGPLFVRGRAGGREVRIPVAIERARSGGAPTDVLGALWARSRVTSLEEALRRGEADGEQIAELGLEHHLVTRFTSFVAVDLSRRVGQGEPTRVVQPVAAPEGVDPVMAGAREAASGAQMPVVAAAPASPAEYAAAAPTKSAPLARPRAGSGLDDLLDGALGGGGGGDTRRAGRGSSKTANAESSTLTRTAIRDGVLRLRPALLQCYDAGLARQPTMAGRVMIRLEIGLDGRVTNATATSSSLGDDAVGACVARVARGARFPAHPGPAPVLVTYPLTFALDPTRPGHGLLR